MRNKHSFKERIACKCLKEACGDTFYKTVKVEFVTNQRGDVIEHKIIWRGNNAGAANIWTRISYHWRISRKHEGNK